MEHLCLHISTNKCLPNRNRTTLVTQNLDPLPQAEACTSRHMKWLEAANTLRGFRRSPWMILVSKTANLSKVCSKSRHLHQQRSSLTCRQESSPPEYHPHWHQLRNVQQKRFQKLLPQRYPALKNQISIDRTKTITATLRIQDLQPLGITTLSLLNTNQLVLNLLEFTTLKSDPKFHQLPEVS